MKRHFLLLIATLLVAPLPAQKTKSIAYTKNINGNNVVICPVRNVRDSVTLELSQLVESCEIVKLDNSAAALFDRAWHADISKSHICIKSYGQQPAKLYDKSGKFICDIGKIGRGPGEYPTLIGLQFSSDGKLIYLFPFGTTRKILVYDTTGKYVRDIPLAFTQRKFKAFVSPGSVTVLSMPFKGDSAICFQQDMNGKVISKIAAPPYLLNQSFDGEVFSNFLPWFDMYNTSSDTIYNYNISGNKLEPKFAKDFGGAKPVTVSYELPGYYYFWFRGEDKKSHLVYVNKKSLDAKYFRLKNDLFGNIEMSPVFTHGWFFNSIAAISLKKQLDTALKDKDLTAAQRQKLTELNTGLKADDNNVIFYGKLKMQ